MKRDTGLVLAFLLATHWNGSLIANPPTPTRTPLLRVVDLNTGSQQEVELHNGKKATVKLLELEETREPVLGAVRARVKVEVNGQTVWVNSALYHLPLTVAGVRIDCPITKGPVQNSHMDHWGLVKDARLRLWPADSPLVEPGTFVYPVKQRWFASATSMANEPVSPRPFGKLYYHSGLDIGGAEGMVEVVVVTEGLVVSSGTDALPGYKETPVAPRHDEVYVLDNQGWYYRYSHLKTIDPAVVPGRTLKMAQKIGELGKEGDSGGWSHLHFEIKSRQPSGKWGTQEAYALLWEAYHGQYQPKLIAVAKPKHFALTGEKVLLDGTRSWSVSGKIAGYEWTFTDGTVARGPRVERTYAQRGTYSEVLRITDSEGRVDYDFATVTVLDKAHPDRWPPYIHAAYAPTLSIQPGGPVTFKVRSFVITTGSEIWDFGDGSPRVTVKSDGKAKALAKDGYATTVHRYEKAGHYLVRVERTDDSGIKAIAHLHVRVGGDR